MDIDNGQNEKGDNLTDAAEIPAVDNTQVLQGDNMNNTEMSAAPQPLTTATKETLVPAWPSRMLIYLRGVSDRAEWQDLVSVLLKFENLNPPSGVGTPLLN
jgi:hypothetical protein